MSRYNSLLPRWIWIIFYTIVVHETRVCIGAIMCINLLIMVYDLTLTVLLGGQENAKMSVFCRIKLLLEWIQFWALLVEDQSSLCDTLSSVVWPSVRLYVNSISSVTKYCRDLFMVTFCWPYGLVVHVQFWSSPDPGTPQDDFVQTHFLSVCFRGFIEVLLCWIHDLDVQYASLVLSNCLGAQKET